MRNLLITLFALYTLSASAGVENMLSNYSKVTDTCVNTGTAYLDITLNNVYQSVSVQIVITEISGATGGSVWLQGSLDGTNFNNVGADTLVPADVASQSHVFISPNTPYKYYRVLFTGTGTMSATIAAKAFITPSAGAVKHNVSNLLDAAGLVDDTIANSATGYIGLGIEQYYENVTIQAVVTRLSGTAGGTVTVQGSINGTDYVTVKAAYITSTSLSVANAVTNTKLFVVTGSPYRYYRLSYTGTGTMSCKLNGYILPNKDNLK
jgi:hypothetical protein